LKQPIELGLQLVHIDFIVPFLHTADGHHPWQLCEDLIVFILRGTKNFDLVLISFGIFGWDVQISLHTILPAF
jgi:hypothetical protein